MPRKNRKFGQSLIEAKEWLEATNRDFIRQEEYSAVWRCRECLSEGKSRLNKLANHISNRCDGCIGFTPFVITLCQYLIDIKEGDILETIDLGHRSGFKIQCRECDHIWFSRYDTLLNNGQWCGRCGGKVTQSLEFYKELAKSRGGVCLSTEIGACLSKLRFQCGELHRPWEAVPFRVRQGTWCPACDLKYSHIEIDCFEYIKTFYSDALHKQKGLLKQSRFELDIWIPSQHAGIEIDGEYWHHSDDAIRRGVPERDARKNLQCVEAGIQLFRVLVLAGQTLEDLKPELDSILSKISPRKM